MSYVKTYYLQNPSSSSINIALDTSGNVGIGTVSPVVKLDVSGGSVNISGRLLVYSQNSTNLTGLATNAMVLGTAAKNVAPSGGQGIFYIISDDPTASALFGSMQLITDPTASNRRLSFSVVEQGIAYRNITFAEGGGNVGIGTTSTATYLLNIGNGANANASVNILNDQNIAGSNWVLRFSRSDNTYVAGIKQLGYNNDSGGMAFLTGTTTSSEVERMRIRSNGDINIGATADAGNALRYFDIYNLNTGNSAGAIIRLVTSNSSASGSTTVDLVKYKNAQFSINNNDSAGFTTFNTAGYERMRIASNGYISLGASAGGIRQVHINGGAGSCEIVMGPGDASSTGTNYLNFCNVAGNYGEGQGVVIRGLSSGGAAQSTLSYLSVYATSSIFSGSISKGSGSFRIEHPLPALSETHDLVHSFIEGPQADLIYRGKATLVDGLALVNIDEAATMTEGTFVILCRDVQCFTTNETDWTPVRGSVEGNILTIEAKDSKSTATISWMVIGERQDKHMIDTGWTDETGKVIVEPLKRPVVDSFINNTDNV